MLPAQGVATVVVVVDERGTEVEERTTDDDDETSVVVDGSGTAVDEVTVVVDERGTAVVDDLVTVVVDLTTDVVDEPRATVDDDDLTTDVVDEPRTTVDDDRTTVDDGAPFTAVPPGRPLVPPTDVDGTTPGANLSNGFTSMERSTIGAPEASVALMSADPPRSRCFRRPAGGNAVCTRSRLVATATSASVVESLLIAIPASASISSGAPAPGPAPVPGRTVRRDFTVVNEPFGLATDTTVSMSAGDSRPSADTISIEYSVLFTGSSTLTRLVPSPPLPTV